jgi:CheY-like chemotaxis protein
MSFPVPEPSILVVGSDPSELARTAAVLESAGYRVVRATEFDPARRRLAAAPPPSLLLTDVQLGAYNGLHLILRGRAMCPKMAAILTHYASDPALQCEAENHGAAFLLKPCSPAELLEAVAYSLELASSH